MFEVELKVRARHAGVRERLAELGADPARAVRQVDTYYDAPDRSFAETDEALRIRRERRFDPGNPPEGFGSWGGAESEESTDPGGTTDPGETTDSRGAGASTDPWDPADPADGDDPDRRAVLTYKGAKVEAGSKTREEVETPVVPGEMATVLDRLGYRAVATVHKDRTVHAVGDYEVTLDSVRGLGAFVEVETEAAEERIGPAREGASDLLRRLGLDPADGITDSYLELLIEAGEDPSGG